jgi:membrane glycosyltransferase
MGLAMTASILWFVGPGLLPWAAPMLLGLGLAIPFAVLTAEPALGRLGARTGLCAVPEERAETETLARVAAERAALPLAPAPAPLHDAA